MQVHIFEVLLKGKPVADIDYEKLASKSSECSGADIMAVIDRAIEDKLRSSFDSGVPEPLKTKDLLNAVKQINPSTKEWFNTAKNYALYSNASGIYDDILDYLKIKK